MSSLQIGRTGWSAILAVVLAFLPQAAAAPTVLVTHGSAVRQYSLTGQYLGDFIPAGVGGLSDPGGIAIGPDGHVYVTQGSTAQVLKYNSGTGAFMGVFASGQGMIDIHQLKFGPDRNLYVSDTGNHRVLRFDGVTGAYQGVSAIGGGIGFATGIDFDAQGRLLLCDFQGSHTVKRFNPATGAFIDNFISVSSPGESWYSADGSDLFVLSFLTNSIRRFDPATGAARGIWASGGGLNLPVTHLTLPDGSMLVTSWGNNRIARFSASGAALPAFAIGGGLSRPYGLALLPEPGAALGVGLGGILLVGRTARRIP